MRKSPQETAAILSYIYRQDFGTKKAGRFQIPAERLRQLSGRAALRDAFIEEVQEYCEEEGLKLTPLGDTYVLLSIDTMLRYRRPPEELIEGFRPAPLRKRGQLSVGTRFRKNFGGEGEEDGYEGTVEQVYKNKTLFVRYDDDSVGIASLDEVEPL